MLDRIALNEPEWGPRIGVIAGCVYNPAIDINFARVIDDVLLGGVIFNNFTGESIGIHSGALEASWINRDMLFVTFDYPFKQLGVNRIFGQVPADNVHAREFNKKLGFKEIAVISGVYRNNVGCVVMRMERDECKYLNIKPRHLQSKKLN